LSEAPKDHADGCAECGRPMWKVCNRCGRALCARHVGARDSEKDITLCARCDE
jgi:hypothetical protein